VSLVLQDVLEDYRRLDTLTDADLPDVEVVTHEDWFAPGQMRVIKDLGCFSFLLYVPLVGDVLLALRLLFATGKNASLLLNQVDRAPQFAAIINRLLMMRKRKVVLYDVFIDTPSRMRSLAVKWQVEGAACNVLFSRYQVGAYMKRFNLPYPRFAYVPYQASHSKRPFLDEPYGDYIFAGGNSARDYRTLCEAVRGTGVRVKVTTTNMDLFAGVELPDEIDITPVVEPAFTQLMAGSRFVVMTLTAGRDRGYGEQTILNSWWHGRAVVVADDVSASDYVTEGKDGYVTRPGDAAALRAHIVDLWNHPEKAEAMGRQGRDRTRTHFHHENFLHRMKMLALLVARDGGFA
jgi:hypothetical protein